MRRTACSLLVLLCLLIGLVMPVFAEQEPQPLSETMESTEQETEPETVVQKVGGDGWIGLVIIAGVLTVLLAGAMIFRSISRRGRY